MYSVCKIYQIFLSLHVQNTSSVVVISIDIHCCLHISFNILIIYTSEYFCVECQIFALFFVKVHPSMALGEFFECQYTKNPKGNYFRLLLSYHTAHTHTYENKMNSWALNVNAHVIHERLL